MKGMKSVMDLKWCCSDFESRLAPSDEGVGIGVMIHSKTGTSCWITNPAQAADLRLPVLTIKFCPWCGRELKPWLDSQISIRKST
jgi:hypothetical protein